MNQIFTKSLMGALVTDQIINSYLWRGSLTQVAISQIMII